MIRGTPVSLLREWLQYYEIEPFGEERADLRAAIGHTLLANANSKRTFKVKDFMPTFDVKELTHKERMQNIRKAANYFRKYYGNSKS